MLFLLVSVLVSILAVELIARVLFRAYADDARYFATVDHRIINSAFILDRKPTDDPKLGGVLSPHATKTTREPEFTFTARTNALGFRTKELEPKRPGEWRVMMVGDSFFFGHGVEAEDTVAEQLERLAREESQREAQASGARRPLSVYNLARMGYTTVQELIVTRTYAPRVQPDQLILGLFPGNDIVPNAASRIDERGNFAPDPAMIARIRADIRSRIGLFRHSMIFRIASISPYMTRLYYQVAREPYILERTYRLLDEFAAYGREHGIALTVVVVHGRDGIKGGLHGAWTQSRPVGQAVTAYCRSRGIPVLDLLEVMDGPDAARRYFYPKDGHLTPAGNRRLAEALYARAVASHLGGS